MLKRYDSNIHRNSPYAQLRYLPQILHDLSFPFLLDMSQEKLKFAYAISLFWGRGGTKSIMGLVHMLNSCRRIRTLHLIYFNSHSNFTSYSPFPYFSQGGVGLKEKYWNLLNVEGRWERVGVWLFSGTTQYFFRSYSFNLQKGRFLMDSNAKIM